MEEKKLNEIHTQIIKHIMNSIKERGIEELAVFSDEIIKNEMLE